MFKECLLLLSGIVSLFMQNVEHDKQTIHLHTYKDDLDITITSHQTVNSLKEIIRKREGIGPTLQRIVPIKRHWLTFKEIGPTLSDDQELITVMRDYKTKDFELTFIPFRKT